LNQLKLRGYDLTKFYVVSHSLGVHLAGKIGELLLAQNILLPRITGLDPAGGPISLKGNAKYIES